MSKADQLVIERRLRPIYDAIDSGNVKKAVQEADKVLKKHPVTVCAKVLKALALIRSDKIADGFEIINNLDVPGAHFDDGTLQAFVHCFKEAGCPDRITTLYERAVAVSPSEQNLTHLFMAHVRNRSFKNQQLVAMRLFKEFNNTPYFFWGVMSIVMQARSNPEMGEKMLYPLAERMLANHVSKHGYKAAAEVELHAMVYEDMGKFAEAEELLGSNDSRTLLPTPPTFLIARRLALLMSSKNYRAVMNRALEGLKADPDDWVLWKMLFDSSFALLKEAESNDEQSSSINVDGLSTIRFRGPHLARLELIGRFSKEEEPIRNLLDGMKLGDTVDLMVNYILRFYAKPCCYNDIVQYLWLLDDNGKEELIEGLNEFIDSVIHQREQAGEDSDANCWAVIMNERLRRTTGSIDKMPREDRRRHVQLIVRGIMEPNRQQLAGTALAQLAAAILWNEWKVHDDWQSFYEMILLLEWTSNEYPTDPFCKLVLCRAYAHIGCVHRLVALTRSLDIKSVQRDTLGYIMFPMPELCGRFNVGIVHYTEMVEVYEQAEKEISEALIGAYRNGAFVQVPNLVALGDRMRMSALSVASNEMHRYFSALFAIDNIDEAVNTLHGNDETIEWDLLCDNRDLGVIPSFEKNIKQELDDLRKSTQTEFIDLTRLRHYISQAIGSAGGAKGAGVEELGADLTLLRVHLKYCRESYPCDTPYSRVMQSPSAVYLGHLIHGGFLDPIVELLQSVFDLGESRKTDGNLSSIAPLSILPSVKHMENLWTVMLPPFEPKLTPFFIQDEIIICSRALQSLVACQLLIKILERHGSYRFPENAPKKGKSAAVSKDDFTLCCEALQTALRNSACRLKSRLDGMENVLKEDSYSLVPKMGTDWNEELYELFTAQNMVVSNRVYKSYFNSCGEIRYFLEHAIKM
ncbi:hypothetical protein KIN20_000423 [Parelaphostrongylus tenuis]|uniref:N-terminal acetyltransferase B complex subunit NAA25 homolog n=1 Tax=Parelaphostrongylus tenuis TaxID=148309 RepID=A0AAD5QFJ9_PARTN|nr:hypothetical protein KIN20_000423 [Parelaphostrongylus tenuis]